jgi:hypothetical protein
MKADIELHAGRRQGSGGSENRAAAQNRRRIKTVIEYTEDAAFKSSHVDYIRH